ncbi:unnamed protein product [Zymoseptoria tritici ST99CH_1E4]|uniref:Cell wall proline rich protein n=1 Tax=Zymoseptoria tritici ST99CH_1E4 TaxID=1276532 RepID=A0A2H1FLA7_ZYMTR|nr:unnamed protein product [Zymoseptoria tritici ST99CH_1E4]
MAEVAMSGQARYSDNMGSMSSPPQIDMIPNPRFVFPMQSQDAESVGFRTPTASSRRRPMSVQLSPNAESHPRTAGLRHNRGVSALPSFSFSATDASGLHEEQPDVMQATPRGGHRRQVSELVGGKGVSGVISSSPGKTELTPSTAISTTAKPGHRHRRSTAISGHELSHFMSPPEAQPRLSSSLPNTPLEHPGNLSSTAVTPTRVQFDEPSMADSPTRPSSRPRVEFSDNVEYIPRPLSTISSETEGSMSTIRGHSVNNSISSMLSLSTPSPPSARSRTTSLGTTLENGPWCAPPSSSPFRRPDAREGEWLKVSTAEGLQDRPRSQPILSSPKLAFVVDDVPRKPRAPQRKRQSLGNALGFDRRRSEPVMAMHVDEPSRLSALSLQESAPAVTACQGESDADQDRRSSTRRIKDWAVSKISRKSRESFKSQCDNSSVSIASSTTTNEGVVPTTPPIEEMPVAETDLDAVFNLEVESEPPAIAHVPSFIEVKKPNLTQRSSFPSPDTDDYGIMLDLDAALGPFNTSSLGSQRPRRGLHSSRGVREFGGMGGQFAPSHSRTYSAPALAAFDHGRSSTPPQAAMADVFEEEEEDEAAANRMVRPDSPHACSVDDHSALGVHLVETADFALTDVTATPSLDDGWEIPASSYSSRSPHLSAPMLERRPSSIIEDTIPEECSPVEPAIVESYEEPRASSLTKSSDSSEASTILGAPIDILALPVGHICEKTHETYSSSAFSSPDFNRRQSSFDTSRVGTSASSITDNRTMSSYTTLDHSHEVRGSVDDVPSLTSSRSTMLSMLHANLSRRDVGGSRTPSVNSSSQNLASAQQRKRSSIHSLSQLMGGTFGSRSTGTEDGRPRTSMSSALTAGPKKKEHRLKKLMFWKSKHRQSGTSTST